MFGCMFVTYTDICKHIMFTVQSDHHQYVSTSTVQDVTFMYVLNRCVEYFDNPKEIVRQCLKSIALER